MSASEPKATAAAPTNGWAAKGFALLHHALAAGVMASAMLGLEHYRVLDWLDAVMLQIVVPRSPATANAATPAVPRLLLLDDQAYAETFELRSPLDRDKLGQLIDDALSARPAVLLIDLQLEPSVGEPAQRALDQRLMRAAQPGGEGRGTRVVLPLPESRTAALDRQALDWMRSLCHAGVHFGSAQVRSHFGTVVRFDQDGATMAQQSLPGLAQPSPLCQLAEQTDELKALWQILDAPSRSTSDSAPLQPAALRAVMQQALNWRPGLTREALQQQRPEVIVIGGAYDQRDSFLTHALEGLVPGAAVHAATIASHGKVDSSHAYGWLFDLGIGTALGFFFHWLWGSIGQAPAAHGGWHARAMFRAWGRLALSGGIWLLALSIAIGLMASMGWLMERGFWLNPGPVVLGMFLHALLLKDAAAEHGDPPDSWSRFTAHSPTWPLQAAAVAAALLYLLSHALKH